MGAERWKRGRRVVGEGGAFMFMLALRRSLDDPLIITPTLLRGAIIHGSSRKSVSLPLTSRSLG